MRRRVLPVSQAVASGGNFLFLLFAGRSLATSDLGILGLVLSWAFGTVGVQRALTSDIFVPRLHAQTLDIGSGVHLRSVGVSLCVSGVSAILAFLTLFCIAGAPALASFLASALIFAWSSLDAQRMLLLGEAKYGPLLKVEISVASVSAAGGLLCSVFFRSLEPYLLLLSVSCVAGWLASRPRLIARGWWGLVRENRSLSVAYIVDFTLGAGSTQLLIVLSALLISAEDVGALRMVMTELGPLNFLLAAGGPLMFAINAKPLAEGQPDAFRKIAFQSVALATIFCFYAALIMGLPGDFVVFVFGPNSVIDGPVLYLLAASGFFSLAGLGATVILRVKEVGAKLLFARISAAVLVPIGVLGSLSFGILAIALTILAMSLTYSVLAWTLAFRNR